MLKFVKSHLKLPLIAIIILALVSSISSGLITSTYRITHGITHTNIQDNERFNDDSLNTNINILEIDSTNRNIEVVVTAPNHSASGLELLLDQAYRLIAQDRRVVGAINGDMYAGTDDFGVIQGMPSCLTIIDGEIITSHQDLLGAQRLPLFAIDYNGNPHITYLFLHITANRIRDEIPWQLNIDFFNRNYLLAPWHTVLFTPRIAGDNTIRLLDANDHELGVENVDDWEFAVVELEDGNGKITAGITFRGEIVYIASDVEYFKVPDNSVVIAGHNLRRLRNVNTGDIIEFTPNIYKTPEDIRDLGEPVNHFNQVIGTYNWIVRDGVALTDYDFIDEGHPPMDWIVTSQTARTGIGIREDGSIIAVTVDQVFGHVQGMTMEEFGQLFYELGAVNAVNFDGGSSTEMLAYHNRDGLITVNTPTGLDPRTISTGLLFVTNSNNVTGIGHDPLNSIIIWSLVGATVVISLVLVGHVIAKSLRKKKHEK